MRVKLKEVMLQISSQIHNFRFRSSRHSLTVLFQTNILVKRRHMENRRTHQQRSETRSEEAIQGRNIMKMQASSRRGTCQRIEMESWCMSSTSRCGQWLLLHRLMPRLQTEDLLRSLHRRSIRLNCKLLVIGMTTFLTK